MLYAVQLKHLVYGGTDFREGAVDLVAEEGQDNDNDDSYEDEDECILYQALALLLQLLNLSAHVCDFLGCGSKIKADEQINNTV